MKYLLSLMLVVLVCGCAFGQYFESGSTLTGSTKGSLSSHVTKNDTTKVMMLVCDTAKVQDFRNSIYVRGVGWLFGYEVTNTKRVDGLVFGTLIDGHPVYKQTEGHSETTHIQWLDENKNPLPSTIIIWQIKIIKP